LEEWKLGSLWKGTCDLMEKERPKLKKRDEQRMIVLAK
jgi:hypothetical protein